MTLHSKIHVALHLHPYDCSLVHQHPCCHRFQALLQLLKETSCTSFLSYKIASFSQYISAPIIKSLCSFNCQESSYLQLMSGPFCMFNGMIVWFFFLMYQVLSPGQTLNAKQTNFLLGWHANNSNLGLFNTCLLSNWKRNLEEESRYQHKQTAASLRWGAESIFWSVCSQFRQNGGSDRGWGFTAMRWYSFYISDSIMVD